MLEAAICFASADVEFAQSLAAYVSDHTGLDCQTAESKPDGDFLDLVEQCLAMRFVFVVLSRQAIPAAWPRASWERVLVEGAAESGTRIAFVMLAECPFPAVLRRRNFFDCSQDMQAGLRSLRPWIFRALYPERVQPRVEVEIVLDDSLFWLVDRPGVATTSSRAAADWLVNKYGPYFESVYLIPSSSRSRTGILGELGEMMGLHLYGTGGQNRSVLQGHATRHRALYVFEGLADGMHDLAELGGKSSVIVVGADGAEPASFVKVRELFSARQPDESACLRVLNAFITNHEVSDEDWEELYSISLRALRWLRERSRLAEAHELLEWLAEEAEQKGDIDSLNHVRWEVSWILQAWNLGVPVQAVTRTLPATQLALSF